MPGTMLGTESTELNKSCSLPSRNSLSTVSSTYNQIQYYIVLYKVIFNLIIYPPPINCRIKSKILSLIFNVFHNLALNQPRYKLPLLKPSVSIWFILFFLFTFQGGNYGIWKFPGQRSDWSYSSRPAPQPQQRLDLSHICDLHHSSLQCQMDP